MNCVLQLSVVIPTRNRPAILMRTLESIRAQGVLPAELIVVDGSEEDATMKGVNQFAEAVGGQLRVLYLKAELLGAATQRNQGVAAATQPVIGFMDDDILLEPECLARLWAALHSDAKIGGANAMITNQRYQSPGKISRFMFKLMGGRGPSFAGQVLGPAVNLLPEDREDLPEIVPTEWLNTTCTLYRREALPNPPFSSHFTGYSLMEDVTVSSLVGKAWKLVNARTARIFHDSQPGSHKADVSALAAMELVNRHYVMTQILERRSLMDYLRLMAWESFQLLVGVIQVESRQDFRPTLAGKIRALRQLMLS